MSTVAVPTITVITVNLDGKDHLEVLLASLEEQSYQGPIEVIVVDNGSKDGSVEFLQTRHPNVRILRNDSNQGFARPNNQAAAVATGELLALVNNDMRLAPDWIEVMVAKLKGSSEDVACVGSRILKWDGSAVDFIRGTVAFNGMGFQPGFDAPIDSPEAKDYPDELLFACGGALLIRRAVFLDAGGFDEDYFAYYEDVDLGWRLWVLGHRVLFCPEAVAYHRHNGTSGRFDWRKKVVLFERNAMFSVLKNYEDDSLYRIWPAALLLAFKRMAIRSGIDRESFRFGPRPPQPAVNFAREATFKKVLRAVKRLGVKGAIKKILVTLAQRTLARWGGRSHEADATAPIMREAYATVVGMEDFIDFLPRMLAKRADIQARRRRPDAEVFRRFGDALTPVEGRPGYPDGHWQVVRELGLDELFEQAILGQAATKR